MTETKNKASCLKPDCGREAVRRGLCNSCYQTVLRLIMLGMTTWDKLQHEGKVLPPARHRNAEWFLGKAAAKK